MRFERNPQSVNISKIPHSRGIFILGPNSFFVCAFFALRFSRRHPFLRDERPHIYPRVAPQIAGKTLPTQPRMDPFSGKRYQRDHNNAIRKSRSLIRFSDAGGEPTPDDHHQAHSAVSYNVFSPSLLFLPTRGTVVRSPLLLRVLPYHECLPDTEASPTVYASPPFTCGIIAPNQVFACFPLHSDRNMILNSLLRPD